MEEKGHPQSMNIISKIVKTPYLIHSEDDFKFFTKRKYVTDALDIISSDIKIGQCLFNKNYAEIESDIDVKGGIFKTTNNGIRYFIHEFAKNEEEVKKWVQKYGTYKNSSYWPHFSFRPSLLRTEIFQVVGDFNEKISHFEMEYAHRYFNSGYISTFFEGIYCLHIGRLTSERNDESKLNAYKLNDEKQFYGKEKSLEKREEKKEYMVENEKKVIIGTNNFKTFIVNLDRRPDRWETFKKNAKKCAEFLNYDRFSAVDGLKLISMRQLQQIFENNDYKMRRGMVGCFMSHMKLFVSLIKENDENIKSYLILEDDIEFQPNFENKFKYFMEQLDKTPSWDLAFLGHHIRDNNNMDVLNNEKMPEIYKIDVYQSFCESLGGTTGFIVSKKGAEKFLDFLNKTGATNGIDTCIQKSANDLNIYYCTPHLILSECYRGDNVSTLDTDIQHDFSSLEKNIEERIKDEIEYFSSKNIELLKVETCCDGFIDPVDCFYYKGSEDEIKKIEKNCCHPNYKIGENCIIIIPESKTKDIECYFHRYKVNDSFNIENAIKYL